MLDGEIMIVLRWSIVVFNLLALSIMMIIITTMERKETQQQRLFSSLFEGRRHLVPVPLHMSVEKEGDQSQEDDGDGDVEGTHQFPHLAPVFTEEKAGPSQCP